MADRPAEAAVDQAPMQHSDDISQNYAQVVLREMCNADSSPPGSRVKS